MYVNENCGIQISMPVSYSVRIIIIYIPILSHLHLHPYSTRGFSELVGYIDKPIFWRYAKRIDLRLPVWKVDYISFKMPESAMMYSLSFIIGSQSKQIFIGFLKKN